jgi:hypothetical protein
MSKHKTIKRNICSELMEGVDSMKEHREGKVTLRTHKPPVATTAKALPAGNGGNRSTSSMKAPTSAS